MTASNEFVQMINHPNYEMMTEYPHKIRRIDNKKEASERENRDGYINVYLNDGDKKQPYLKHRLIAEQFIPNSNNLPVIDHINHNRTDNRIENLRWCSSSTNSYNKSSFKGVRYEFIDDIHEDAIIVDFYDTRTERREFEADRYYFYHNENSNEDLFYSRIDENVYKILHINTNRSGSRYVQLMDTNNRAVSAYINRFKQQHDLI